MAYPDHLHPDQARIIDLIIKKALDQGNKISVYGEGELDLSRSRDYEKITAEVAATCQTDLRIRHGDRDVTLGTITLIHVNCPWEVIADHTDNPYCADLLVEASALAEGMDV